MLSTTIGIVSYVSSRELSIGGSMGLSTLLWIGHITRIMGWGQICQRINLRIGPVWGHIINSLSMQVITLATMPTWVRWRLSYR